MITIPDLINAKKDTLTGCYTKDSLLPIYMKLSGEFEQNKSPFSLLLTDLDRFKKFNDKYGHLFGDEVLKYFGSSLRLSLEQHVAIPVRYGGDEFIIVFPGKNAEEAYAIGVEVERNIKNRPFLWKGILYRMTFSGGIASFPSDAGSLDDLIKRADKAMYFSKHHGHARVTQFSKIKYARVMNFFITILLLILIAAGIVLVFRAGDRRISGPILNKAKATISRITGFFKGGKGWMQKKPANNLTAPDGRPVNKNGSQPASVKIYLKGGAEMEGSIIHEDAFQVLLELDMGGGEGVISIRKTEIERIVKIEGN